jgi:hypothetical protein
VSTTASVKGRKLVTLYEDWLDAYGSAYEDPESLAALACPNCRAKTLHLRFPLLPEPGDSGGAGNAAFWCSTCLQGILTSRTPIPPWAQALLTDEAAAAAQKFGIPNYRIIPPELDEDHGEVETA